MGKGWRTFCIGKTFQTRRRTGRQTKKGGDDYDSAQMLRSAEAQTCRMAGVSYLSRPMTGSLGNRVVILATLVSGLTPTRSATGQPCAYVANLNSDTVSVIEIATNLVR